MKRFIFITISLLLSISSFSQTYYYELVSTKKQGVSQIASEGGFYITIGNNCCYDSDAKGNSISSSITGSFKMSYKGVQNYEHKYSGNSFWFNSAFYFSDDYSNLRVKSFETGDEYFFKSLANTGKESTHKQALEKINSLVYQSMPSSSATTIPSTTNPAMNNNTSSTTNHICSGCGGTGICTSCHGTGGYWVDSGYYTGSNSKTWTTCPVCHGSGRCGVCHGKGKL